MKVEDNGVKKTMNNMTCIRIIESPEDENKPYILIKEKREEEQEM